MEMPIQVVITLFVAITVGALLIMFSETILSAAGIDVTDLFPAKQDEAEDVIEVNTITNSQVAALITSCYEKSYGKAPGTYVCYAIHADAVYAINSGGIMDKLPAELKDQVDIAEGNAKTVWIRWNFNDSKVEVTT